MTDLSMLAAPNIIEALDYETILAERKSTLVSLYPSDEQSDIETTLALESEPAVKQLEENAYREIVLRNRINDAAKAVMIQYANDNDLDNLAANFDVERLTITPADETAVPPVDAVMEANDDLRTRIPQALAALSVAGPAAAYRFHALSADGRVLDAGITSPSPMHVLVSIVSRNGNGTAEADLIAAVESALSDEDVRPLCDIVTVQSAEIINYQITAKLYVSKSTDKALTIDAAITAAQDYATAKHKTDKDIARSAIFAALHQTGVIRVELTSPAADITISKSQTSYCTGIIITAETADE